MLLNTLLRITLSVTLYSSCTYNAVVTETKLGSLNLVKTIKGEKLILRFSGQMKPHIMDLIAYNSCMNINQKFPELVLFKNVTDDSKQKIIEVVAEYLCELDDIKSQDTVRKNVSHTCLKSPVGPGLYQLCMEASKHQPDIRDHIKKSEYLEEKF